MHAYIHTCMQIYGSGIWTDRLVHTYIHTYMHACMHTYIHVCRFMEVALGQTDWYIHTHMHAYIHTCMQINGSGIWTDRLEFNQESANIPYIHTTIRTFIHACINTCMHACIHTYMYVDLWKWHLDRQTGIQSRIRGFPTY